MSNTDILNGLTVDSSFNWLDRVEWRKRNSGWLKNSARIAIIVLSHLKSKNMSQKQLAEEMGVTPQYVNKIVKGSENLTLETIDKLESVLGVRLIEINSESFDSRGSTHRMDWIDSKEEYNHIISFESGMPDSFVGVDNTSNYSKTA